MSLGKVETILIGPVDEGPMQRVGEVNAVAGRGLEGDRYFHPGDDPGDPTEEITLIEVEPIESAAAEHGLELVPEDMRRNIVTRGVELRALIGKRFTIGEVEIEALEDNPPCRHLQKLADKPLLKPMIEKGGVRGRIVRGGTIRAGDPITLVQNR
jgi:MOSC domain-containing protein YiiM